MFQRQLKYNYFLMFFQRGVSLAMIQIKLLYKT